MTSLHSRNRYRGALLGLSTSPMTKLRDRYHGALLGLACGDALGSPFENSSKEELISPAFYQGSLVPEIREVAAGSYKQKNPPEIVGSGYVVRSLEAALLAFYHSSTFEEGALPAANLGNDADTTAAVFGQLGGAYYGIDGIPQSWLEKLAMGDRITQLTNDLLALAAHKGPPRGLGLGQ
jgi:ADP-ribosyl-[dinitrogen reductase] hydrolase